MTYQYFYQRHPFDDKNYFSIQANSQADADEQACRYMDKLIADKQTVMTNCYRSDRATPNPISKKEKLAYILFYFFSIMFANVCYFTDRITTFDYGVFMSVVVMIAVFVWFSREKNYESSR